MYYSRTPGCRIAKRLVGQTNHLLLTSVLGLYELRANGATQVEHLPGRWDPLDSEKSIERADLFLRSSSLVWIVDALDVYSRSLAQHHPSIFKDDLLQILKDRGVWKKLEALSPLHNKQGRPICSAMVMLGIAWRNRLVHSGSSDSLPTGIRGQLKNMSELDHIWFRNLNPSEMVTRFDDNKHPRFKEVTSIIQAAISWIIDLDKIIVSMVDTEEYSKVILMKHLTTPHQRSNYLQAPYEKKVKMIGTLLSTAGFAFLDKQSLPTSQIVDINILDSLIVPSK